jgi:hypothetical protein
VAAAHAARLLPEGDESTDRLVAAARHRAAVPDLPAEVCVDLELARLVATVALRRHARGEPVAGPGSTRRGGRDLRDVRLVVGSGGVLRHAPPAQALNVLAALTTDRDGAWPLPRAARSVIDTDYVLASAGLLAVDHPAAARALLQRHLYNG